MLHPTCCWLGFPKAFSSECFGPVSWVFSMLQGFICFENYKSFTSDERRPFYLRLEEQSCEARPLVSTRRWRWACRAAGAVHQGPAGCTGLDYRKSSASTYNGRVLTAPPRPWLPARQQLMPGYVRDFPCVFPQWGENYWKETNTGRGCRTAGQGKGSSLCGSDFYLLPVLFLLRPCCSFFLRFVPFSFALFLLRPSCSLTKSDKSVFQTTRRKLGPWDAPPLTVLVPCSVQYVGGYLYPYACKRWRLFAFCY